MLPEGNPLGKSPLQLVLAPRGTHRPWLSALFYICITSSAASLSLPPLLWGTVGPNSQNDPLSGSST